ncbi:restriction endonuclease subunit S [Variovorax sp. M-6]|uniref:restriction endonuclease subunit S n=1 Tax=Variovorax sp. M-6 TaxID=3233041 RepID=UPI003F98288C
MSLPRYSAYKDSGVQWLGEVPTEWGVAPLKRGYGVVGGSTPKSEVEDYWDGKFIWVTPADLSRLATFEIADSLRKITEQGLQSCGTTIVPRGSIVLSTRAPIGSLGIAAVELCTNQGCKALVPRSGQLSRFTAYFLSVATEALNVRGKGTTFLELSADELAAFRIPSPTTSEQEAVSAFLDRETAKIDALVAEQKRLIALLKEKRQAVISHAVTKGLDPKVPMKDSGVEWLGEVPAHWKTVPLKFVATVQTGIAKGKDNTGKETTTVPYLRVANVQDGYLALDDMASIEIPASDVPRYLLRSGDVLMNEGGDFDKLGRGHIWRAEIEPCIHQNHVFAVRPHGISPEWLNTITGSAYAQFYFMTRSKQSTNLASISSSNIMDLPIVLPPIAEQVAILDFIGRQAAQLDELSQQAQTAVGLLQERRTALISAAVTGKIDVRGAVTEEVA